MYEIQETQIRSLRWKDPLEEGMATHCSFLAWRIPWAEEPGGLQSTGLQSQIRLKRLTMHALHSSPNFLWMFNSIRQASRTSFLDQHLGFLLLEFLSGGHIPAAVMAWPLWVNIESVLLNPVNSQHCYSGYKQLLKWGKKKKKKMLGHTKNVLFPKRHSGFPVIPAGCSP